MIAKNALFLAFVLVTVQCVQYKHLQGDPSEFSSFQLPPPQQTAEVSTGGYTPIYIESTTNPVWSGSADCDSTTEFTFCMLTPLSIALQVKPPGVEDWQTIEQVLSELNGVTSTSEVGLSIDDLFPSTCYSFANPQIGSWSFQVTATSPISKLNIVKSKKGTPILKPSGYIYVTNDSPYVLKTYSNEDQLLVGNTVTITGEVLTTNAVLGNSNFILALETIVTDPDGEEITVDMYDDGLHSDGDVNDGTFAGSLQLTEVGNYVLETIATGLDSNGNYIYRSTMNYFSAVKSDLQIGAEATATVVGDIAEITIKYAGSEAGVINYLAYAEVWGTSSTGSPVPVAWVSAISDASSDIQLELDVAWISKAGAVAPFTLKNVRIQDSNIQTVLSAVSELPLNVIGNLPTEQLEVTEITDQMRNGRRPESLTKPGLGANGKLLLVHGYCANGNPFTKTDFTNYLEFNDPKANRNLDTFANLILNFAESKSVDSFSIVGHSQGGLASLHLASYYWSGLDVATGGRLIQSVGSPYQGTALAGGLAGIGGVFGVGCGQNDGMTKSGAQKWLSGIPAEKQAKVYYWTTEGSSTCSSGANFLGLDKPNDGVTSKNYSQLPSGNNMGHSSGWCHTADMSSPSQTTDSARNKLMNSNAAR